LGFSVVCFTKKTVFGKETALKWVKKARRWFLLTKALAQNRGHNVPLGPQKEKKREVGGGRSGKRLRKGVPSGSFPPRNPPKGGGSKEKKKNPTPTKRGRKSPKTIPRNQTKKKKKETKTKNAPPTGQRKIKKRKKKDLKTPNILKKKKKKKTLQPQKNKVPMALKDFFFWGGVPTTKSFVNQRETNEEDQNFSLGGSRKRKKKKEK